MISSHKSVYKVINRRTHYEAELDAQQLLDFNRKSHFDIIPIKQRLSIAQHYEQQYFGKTRNLKS